jgi:pimeloyl-ACP methyl ester carboxylesterase
VERATVDDITLEYEVSGAGAPVVFIHGALIADAFRPLLAEPDLAERYRCVSYHRRGYLGSSHSADPVSIGRQAADCGGLLRHLGIERAHVVGHSYGGSIALQLALDDPDVVHSLVLLEPALVSGDSARGYRDAIARNNERFTQGDAAGTVDDFLQSRFGVGYRAWLDRAAPGAFEQAVADAGTTFIQELPTLLEWRFTETEARRITQPVLAVLGGESDALWPRFGETHRLLLAWLPQADGFVLPGATHALQMQKPREMAQALARFLARHPLPIMA